MYFMRSTSEITNDKGIICQFFNSSKLNIIVRGKLISRAPETELVTGPTTYDHKTRLLPHSQFPYIEISILGFVFDSYSIRIIISIRSSCRWTIWNRGNLIKTLLLRFNSGHGKRGNRWKFITRFKTDVQRLD